jgi:hypothetical protein
MEVNAPPHLPVGLEQASVKLDEEDVISLVLDLEANPPFEFLQSQQPSLYKPHAGGVKNPALDEEMKGPSDYLEGLRWGSGLYKNTCPIDGPLTLLALHHKVNPHERFIEQLQENKCLRVQQVAVILEQVIRGNGPMAQCLIGNMVTKGSQKFDLHGSVLNQFVDPLKEASTFGWKRNCKLGHKIETLDSVFVVSTHGMTSKSIPTWIREKVLQTLGTCKKCQSNMGLSSPPVVKQVAQKTLQPAKLFFIIFEQEQTLPWHNLLDLDEEVFIGGERYTKAFTTVRVAQQDHFIQIFSWKGRRMVYDGMGGPQGVYNDYRSYPSPSIISTVENVTYIHRPRV